MCEKGKESECKKGLKVKAGDCSPEQIRECHGSEGDHPCASEEKTD